MFDHVVTRDYRIKICYLTFQMMTLKYSIKNVNTMANDNQQPPWYWSGASFTNNA